VTGQPVRGPFAAAVEAYEAGRFADSEAACRNLLKIDPKHVDALHLLALSLAALGSADSIDVLRRALAARKKDPGLWLALGNAQARAGNRTAAADAYRGALRVAPAYGPAHVSLGRLHFDEGRFAEAGAALRRALDMDRDGEFAREPDLWDKLGYALSRQGRISDAAACYRRALALDPKNLSALANLAMAQLEHGEIADAVVTYERALAVAPKLADLRSNALLALNYGAEFTADEIFRHHLDWDARHGQVTRLAPSAQRAEPSRLGAGAGGRIRIGYVSADLRTHPVTQFLLPLLAAHRRDQVSATCYSATAREDATTERLRGLSDAWRDIRALSDDEAANRIAADGIDVLIDLGGHTADNRLGIFARKPATLQATWLGYPNTTGLSAIDLRITDGIADPPGAADRLHSESLLRLPGCFLCYGAPADAPPVAPLPALANGFVTLGSFNNSMKVTPATAALWAEILVELPTARLLLKSPLFADDAIRARYLGLLTRTGIERGRIELLSAVPDPRDHLALYQRVDIALDSFPYNGTTTTCEALWMGCPVVTLAGDRHAGRVGASLLTAAGLAEQIAANTAEYRAKIRGLAGDLPRLAKLRGSLRERVAGSALCDAATFAAGFEDALRGALAARQSQA
jgi:predicted O-linked N-acetylglucosamine transferase (SPINDLY family)